MGTDERLVNGTDEEMGTATALDTGTAASSTNPGWLECHYAAKNPTWDHTGRKTHIRMKGKRTSPKCQFVCPPCLKWLKADAKALFEFSPCTERNRTS